jgi:hypothetical protein
MPNTCNHAYVHEAAQANNTSPLLCHTRKQADNPLQKLTAEFTEKRLTQGVG